LEREGLKREELKREGLKREELDKEGMTGSFFVKVLPKKQLDSQCTCSCNFELYDFPGFFPKLASFAGFSLYFINIAGRISTAEIGRGKARSSLFFV
jgi:hypothetical protein